MISVMFGALKHARGDAVPWLLDLLHHFQVTVVHDDLVEAFDWLLRQQLPRGRIAWDDVPFKQRLEKMPKLLPNVVRLAIAPPQEGVAIIVASEDGLPATRELIAEHANPRASLVAQEEARA